MHFCLSLHTSFAIPNGQTYKLILYLLTQKRGLWNPFLTVQGYIALNLVHLKPLEFNFFVVQGDHDLPQKTLVKS